MRNRQWTLYVLRLEHDKWYVGITSIGVEKRFTQHRNGFAGALWTKKYRPIEIYYSQDLGLCPIEKAQVYEGRVTRKYMEKYGDNNVRGGDLTDVEEYLRRFGYFMLKDNWELTLFLVTSVLINILLIVDKFYL